MNMKRFVIITVAALGAYLTTAAGALAQNVDCNGSFTSFQTVNGNLNVPNGATCSLTGGVKVTGNVTVGNGASFLIEGNSTIGGNLQANNCSNVIINPFAAASTVIGGNVEIGNCSGGTVPSGPFVPNGTAGASVGPKSAIGGNFECHNNTGPCILWTNTVGGNVHVHNNVSSSASEISGNTIAKNLQCENNSPAPTDSPKGPNTVAGNSQGQCATGF